MPRKSKGLSYLKYDSATLEKALKTIRAKKLSFGAASKEFGVPKSTLIDHFSRHSNLEQRPGRRRCLTQDIENDIVGAPNEVLSHPFEDTAPLDVTTVAPLDLTTVAPLDVMTAAPLDVMTAAPLDVTTAAPLDVTTAAPLDVTTAAPLDVTTVAALDVTTAALLDVTTAAPSMSVLVAAQGMTNLCFNSLTRRSVHHSVKMPRKSMKYNSASLEKALEAIKIKKLSFGAASKEFGVPKTTLKDHFSGRSNLEQRPGRKRYIPQDIENDIVDKVIEAAAAGFPITKRQLLLQIGMVVKKLKLKTVFKNQVPGDDYWRRLKNRRPDLAIRSADACSINKMPGISHPTVINYCKELERLVQTHNLSEKPHCIWSADETGLQFSQNSGKVQAKKGTRNRIARGSNSREGVKTVVCISGAGQAMPPLCVVKGKTLQSVQSFNTLDAPQNTMWTFQEDAWVCDVLGVEWFENVFLKHCGPERPQLLILDSHGSHEVLDLLDLARKNTIELLGLPPHTRHVLQPLSKVVFGPLKHSYKRVCTEYLSESNQHIINKVSWPALLTKTWDDIMREDLLKKAFEITGIVPVNKNIISDIVFSSAEALNHPSEDTAAPLDVTIAAQDVTTAAPSMARKDTAREMTNLSLNSLTDGSVHQSVKMPGKSKKYNLAILEKALEAIKEKKLSFGAASKEFNVPKTTLIDHFHGRSNLEQRPGRKRYIPQDIENDIVDKVIEAAAAGFPITKRQLLLQIGMVVKKLKLKTMFKNQVPGDDYWRRLKNRRPDLVIRSADACSINKMPGLSHPTVMNYFKELEILVQTHNLSEKPHCIWSADETGLQFSQNSGKAQAKKGTRNRIARGSNSREGVKTVVCISGAGQAMPPLCVVKGKTLQSVQSFNTLDAPQNTMWTFQEDAWVCDVLGVEWFENVFLKHCGPERPQLLILDSHGSHEVLDLLDLARKNSIELLALPPHTKHVLQPLNKVVFGLFKRSYKRVCTEYLSENTLHIINKVSWSALLTKTWDDIMREDLLKKAFETTGIVPVNKNIIPDIVFSPDETLNHSSEDTAAPLNVRTAAPLVVTTAATSIAVTNAAPWM